MSAPPPVKKPIDREIIDRFESGGEKLAAAVHGLTPEQLQARPGPGKWSIHELVVHLADSDAIAIDRMKRIVTEDNPWLFNADEMAYVDRLFYHDQSVEDALALFSIGRRQFACVLRRLPDEALQRIGTHDRRGQERLVGLVEANVKHLEHHLRFLDEKRQRLDA